MRPTIAEIRLGSLVQNYKLLEENVRAHAGKAAGLIAVVKANAYGHGLALCGRALGEAGAPWLGVTSVEEALALRAVLGKLQARVLVMSGFFPGEEGAVLQNGLTPQVWEWYHLGLLDAAARRMGLPARSVAVHLEIDTGMSRQGVAPGEALAALVRGARFEHDSPVFVEGVLTHFSSPEMPGNGVMAGQVRRLSEALKQLLEAGIRPRWVHAGNSANASLGVELESLAGVARRTGAELIVRPGLALYGIGFETPRLQPVMRWRTEVVSLREVGAGVAVGYNETFIAERPMRLALLPVGYADGLNRLLSNRGSVLVQGQRAPMVGRISMDQTVVDVSAIAGVTLGDEAVLLGSQGGLEITAGELANLCGTIPYEVVCGVGARVPRVAI